MPLRVYDDRRRELLFIRPPRRIVSLVPSDTLNVFAVGAGDRLVGRTRYCIAPERRVEAIPVVGGTKDVDVLGIQGLATGGDVIVAIDGTSVRGADDVVRLVSFTLEPKQVAVFTVVRGGVRKKIAVTLGERQLPTG